MDDNDTQALAHQEECEQQEYESLYGSYEYEDKHGGWEYG